ncbi:ribosome silencing factor [Maridesulfovibrio bastinii]|uniref:ribosome silencing factor n=1 Tax=Maridesulfovibrio bastinii TaxID=47157 RepID=UPI00041F11CC|nr:ribosome silencing factor [Maridesulfovibrio bastinii]
MENKAKKFIEIDTKEKARKVAGWLDDKQASEIIGIDVHEVCPIAEIVMVVTAKGVRHSQALADHILGMLAENKIEYLGMEGYKSGDWILLDLNDIIVHIFQEDNRSFYNIEGLWSEGTQIELDS